MRLRSIALVSAGLLTLAVGGCSSDDRSAPATTTDTAPSSQSVPSDSTVGGDPVRLAAGVVPAGSSEITDAADVPALLATMGFPTAWPMPDGLVAADVLGLEASQTAGSDGTKATFSLTWRQAAGALDDAAQQWFETANSALAVGPLIGTSKTGSGAVAGVSYSAGADDEPSGRLSVTASSVDAGSIAVQVEFEYVNESPTPTLQFAPSTIAALPSITGCVPELVQASFVRYDAPNAAAGQRDYTTIFQGRCASRATFDSTVSWAVGRDGRITQDEDSIEVTDSTGPDGESLHVGASASGSVRIDTAATVG